MLNEMMFRPVVKPEVVEYMRKSQRFFPGKLGELEQMANDLGIPIIPHETAVYLDFLLGLYRPTHILEIGTAIGFSASLMAQYVPKGGSVTTIDRYELMYSRAKENFKKLGIDDVVTQIEGDAAHVLPTLEQQYDFIFMDSAKAKYIEFFPHCMRVLKTGGVLVVDDIFQGGDIAKDIMEVRRGQRTIYRGLQRLFDATLNNPGLTASLVPLGDGILMLRKNQAEIELPDVD